MEELETLRDQNSALNAAVLNLSDSSILQATKIARLQDVIFQLTQENSKVTELQGEIAHLKQERDSLKQSSDLLRAKVNNNSSLPALPVLFRGNYNYKRENVVQLSQLISRYLENKPSAIDQHKIFNCVRACFMDLEKGFQDNPQHYYMDVRMLLVTCLASTWFTPNQRSNIDNWYRNHFCFM